MKIPHASCDIFVKRCGSAANSSRMVVDCSVALWATRDFQAGDAVSAMAREQTTTTRALLSMVRIVCGARVPQSTRGAVPDGGARARRALESRSDHRLAEDDGAR